MALVAGAADPQIIDGNLLASRSADSALRYASVGYADVYPGIDIMYSPTGGNLRYSSLLWTRVSIRPPSPWSSTVPRALVSRMTERCLSTPRAGRDLLATAPITYQEIGGTEVPGREQRTALYAKTARLDSR